MKVNKVLKVRYFGLQDHILSLSSCQMVCVNVILVGMYLKNKDFYQFIGPIIIHVSRTRNIVINNVDLACGVFYSNKLA